MTYADPDPAASTWRSRLPRNLARLSGASIFAFFILAYLLIYCLLGGTSLLHSLPAYGLLSVAAVLALFHRVRGTTQPALYCVVATGLMVGYVLWRASASPVPYLARADFYMALACAVAYLLVATHFNRTFERQLILGVLMLLAVVEVGISLQQSLRGDDLMLFGFKRPPSGRRASGFFISPNHFAGFLEAIGVMALSCACWSRWRLGPRILTGYAALVCFIGVGLSGSRGGYLSTAFCLAVFVALSVAVIWVSDRRKAMLFGLAGLVVIGGGLLLAVQVIRDSGALSDRMSRLQDQFRGMHLDIRVQNWQAALDQAKVEPWLGTGAGTHLYLGRYFRRPELQSDPVHAHSDYLELLAEYGYAGAAVVALFVGAHLWAAHRRLRAVLRDEVLPRRELQHNDLALTLGAVCAVAAIAVHSAVDFNLHIPGNALLFAFIFALLSSRPQSRAEDSPSPDFYLSRIGLTLLCALVAGAFLAPLPVVFPILAIACLLAFIFLILTSPAGAVTQEAPARFHWSRLVLPGLGLWLAISGLPKVSGEYWSQRARSALERGDLTAVEKAVARGTEKERQNPYLYFYLGEAKRLFANDVSLQVLSREYFAQAVVAFHQSLAIFPQEFSTWLRLGQAYDGLKDFEAAKIAYQTAHELDPNSHEYFLIYAEHLHWLGREAEAEENFHRGKLLSTGRPLPATYFWWIISLHQDYARRFYRLRRTREARDLYEQAKPYSPTPLPSFESWIAPPPPPQSRAAFRNAGIAV